MEQFSLEKWLQDKSRKVVTKEGKNVKIIHTDSPVPQHPIVGFIDKSIYAWTIDGKLIYSKEEPDKNDLFFADEEEELTEFEKRVYSLINFSDPDNFPSIEEVKEESEILLDLARKELEKEYRIVDKDDSNWEDGYKQCKRNALKDLPKWRKITEEKQNYLAYGYLSHDGYYLSIQELKDKLPKEE